MSPQSLIEHLSVIEDPRRSSYGHRHDFIEILVITVCAMLSEVEGFEDIADWAQIKQPWLKRFLTLKNGVPSHDTFSRVFRLLDPIAFESAFRAWVGSVLGAFSQVALDGKSLRGSGHGPSAPLHLVSAFATEQGLVLGQEAVAKKSNEIRAIPQLLEALDIKGSLVSIDAMGCQKQIAHTIVQCQADYLLTVKNNPPSLRQALEEAFADVPVMGFEHTALLHGRQVVQHAQSIFNTGYVDTEQWPHCQRLGRIASWRLQGQAPPQLDIRYYISSAALTHQALHTAVRQHWAIENNLHWSLDVIFNEDACNVRKDHAPQNLSVIRRILLNLLRQDHTHPKMSLKKRRKIAGWDDERMRLLGIKPL